LFTSPRELLPDHRDGARGNVILEVFSAPSVPVLTPRLSRRGVRNRTAGSQRRRLR